MSPRARRILIPFVVGLFAVAILLPMFVGPKGGKPSPTTAPATNAAGSTTVGGTTAATPADGTAQAPADGGAVAATQPVVTATGWRAVAPRADDVSVAAKALGSVDPRKAQMRVELSRWGAGIQRVDFSDIWETARARRQAEAYVRGLAADAAFDESKVDASQRYVLVERHPQVVGGRLIDTPVFAARAIVINGTVINLVSAVASATPVWSETGAGEFQTRIEDEKGKAVALVTRRYSVGEKYDIEIQQRVENLTDEPLSIVWEQFGPVDLRPDQGYIDRRRLHIGYVPDPRNNPTQVLSNDQDYVTERSAAIKRADKAANDPARRGELLPLWPTAESTSRGWELSWVGMTNRYFGLGVHPPIVNGAPQTHSIQGTIGTVEIGDGSSERLLYTLMRSPEIRIEPGTTSALDIGVYAGPLDRRVLSGPPYNALAMSGMIVYSMSGCCTFLTFQWLADFLILFLSFLHDYIVFDWGLAIIVLVIIVRTLLHPLTKKSQINMQRFGKQMAAMKPELDKVQKKFAGDPKKAQAEQMRLMREHKLNPVTGALGCLPMFLQMPIWIALWAMLYLAFDIRQQPAFYGVFQLFGNWQFLGDLSAPDNFIMLPGNGFNIPLVDWHIPSINLLPLLMSVVFFIQQKYMSPPPTPNMTPEQIQQQKIMKWMMVILFPLMLYKAPSGLTLYIFTSTCIGILESKYVRKHIEQMDKNPPPFGTSGGGDGNGGGGGGGGSPPPKGEAWGGPEKPKKIKDLRSRLFGEAIERAKAKREAAQQKSFKKRK